MKLEVGDYIYRISSFDGRLTRAQIDRVTKNNPRWIWETRYMPETQELKDKYTRQCHEEEFLDIDPSKLDNIALIEILHIANRSNENICPGCKTETSEGKCINKNCIFCD